MSLAQIPPPSPRWVRDLPWFIFVFIFIFYAYIRAHYSYINFNNNGDEAGVEKLFNLSLQQSFLFGTSFPPEWIWLSGEQIKYYSFLRSLPGLASWLARVLFNDTQTGGILFILSEAFVAALTPAILCGAIQWFGSKESNQKAIGFLGAILGLFCFFSAHFQAVSLGVRSLLTSSSLDWWSLSRQVIPFTDNQYPVWLMILGDNHAYMQTYFLQVMCWAFFLNLILETKRSVLKAVSLGVLTVSLLLSHPASILIDATVIGTFNQKLRSLPKHH